MSKRYFRECPPRQSCLWDSIIVTMTKKQIQIRKKNFQSLILRDDIDAIYRKSKFFFLLDFAAAKQHSSPPAPLAHTENFLLLKPLKLLPFGSEVVDLCSKWRRGGAEEGSGIGFEGLNVFVFRQKNSQQKGRGGEGKLTEAPIVIIKNLPSTQLDLF